MSGGASTHIQFPGDPGEGHGSPFPAADGMTGGAASAAPSLLCAWCRKPLCGCSDFEFAGLEALLNAYLTDAENNAASRLPDADGLAGSVSEAPFHTTGVTDQ
jgi:hypothetical protein